MEFCTTFMILLAVARAQPHAAQWLRLDLSLDQQCAIGSLVGGELFAHHPQLNIKFNVFAVKTSSSTLPNP